VAQEEWDCVVDLYPLLHKLFRDLQPMVTTPNWVSYYKVSQKFCCLWIKRCIRSYKIAY